MGFHRKGKAMNQDHIATPEEDEAFNMIEQQSNLGKQILRDMEEKKDQIVFVGSKLPKAVMTLSEKGIWVDPDIPVDEAAKAVIEILDQHYKATYEQGIQEGMKRERALWLMQAEGQKIEQPKREWVGLTDDEIDLIYWGAGEYDMKRAREIEAKLKEKNT
jgi:hypothetical protein